MLYVIAMIALTVSGRAFANCGGDPECDDIGPWLGFTSVSLIVSDPDSKQSVTWGAEFDHEKMDILIHVDSRNARR